jgi:transposase
VRRPRDKAKVEAAVLIVERFVLAALRDRRFSPSPNVSVVPAPFFPRPP